MHVKITQNQYVVEYKMYALNVVSEDRTDCVVVSV